MTRQDIRTGIAAYFGGSAVSAGGWYQPTPLVALGLAGVKPYWKERFEDHEYFTGLADARTGAILCVHLEDDTEKRLAIGGILDAPFNVTLYLWLLSRGAPVEAAQAACDDLLDALKAMLRADPTLGMGVNSSAPVRVTQAGEGEAGIRISSPPPYGEPPKTTRQNAVISFTANTYPAG